MVATPKLYYGSTSTGPPPIGHLHSGGAPAGAGSISVDMDQGTFAPGANQQFDIVLNPPTGFPPLDLTGPSSYTERLTVASVTGSGPYTLTFAAGQTLAHNHVAGEYVMRALSGTELAELIQPASTVSTPAQVDFGGARGVDVAAGVSSTDLVTVGQLPSAVPVLSAAIAQGMSYLGAVNISVDPPVTPGVSTMARILGMLHVPEANFHDMTTSGGVLIGNGGPALCAWDAVLSRVGPPSMSGVAGTSGQGSGEARILGSSTNTHFPSTGQPLAVIFGGVNDLGGVMAFQPTVTNPPVCNTPAGPAAGYTPSTFAPLATTVAAGSNGVNVSTFAGSGTLNVASATGFPATGSIIVATSTGFAVISYTGGSSTTFTGCTTVSGTGTLSTGGGVVAGSATTLIFAGATTSIGSRAVKAGDFLVGAGLSGQVGNSFGAGAKLTTVANNTPSTFTTLTFTAAQLTAMPGGNYVVVPGDYAQAALALQHVYECCIARYLAGSVVRSDDLASSPGNGSVAASNTSTFAYTNGSGGGGSWTTPTQFDMMYGWLGHTGPTVAQVTTTPGASVNPTFTLTLPANFPGGAVNLVLIGTGETDGSGSFVSWTGTSSASGSANTPIAAQGFAGFTVPVVARFVLTAADAGKTIVGTFHSASGTATLQVDSANFDATYEGPVLIPNQPAGCIISNPVFAACIDWAIANACYTFTNTNSGSGVTQCGVANTYSHVSRVDLAALFAKNGFWLGSTLLAHSQGTVDTGVVLVGQTIVGTSQQVAPYVNQNVIIPNPIHGGQLEIATVTAVASGANLSVGGVSYPTWTVSFKRSNSIFGSQVGLAVTGAVGHYTGAGVDVTTLSASSIGYSDDQGTAPSSGTVVVPTTFHGVATRAVISYTGKSGGNLTGCNLVAGGGTLATNAPVVVSQIDDLSWTAPDITHPGDAGGARIAAEMYRQLNLVFNSDASWQAASNLSWTQRRTRSAARPPFRGVVAKRGFTGSGLSNLGTTFLIAVKYTFTELVLVDRLHMFTGAPASASQLLYAGICENAAGGDYPGVCIEDFQLAGFQLTGAATAGWNVVAGGNAYQRRLEPGSYWFLAGSPGIGAAGTTTGGATFRQFGRMHGDMSEFVDIATALGVSTHTALEAASGTLSANASSASGPGNANGTLASGASAATGAALVQSQYFTGSTPNAQVVVGTPNTLTMLMPTNTPYNPYGEAAGAYEAMSPWTPTSIGPIVVPSFVGHSFGTIP